MRGKIDALRCVVIKADGHDAALPVISKNIAVFIVNDIDIKIIIVAQPLIKGLRKRHKLWVLGGHKFAVERQLNNFPKLWAQISKRGLIRRIRFGGRLPLLCR